MCGCVNVCVDVCTVQYKAKWKVSQHVAERTLEVTECWDDEQLPKRQEFLAALHSYIGNAQLELGEHQKALEHHRKDFDIGRAK